MTVYSCIFNFDAMFCLSQDPFNFNKGRFDFRTIVKRLERLQQTFSSAAQVSLDDTASESTASSSAQ